MKILLTGATGYIGKRLLPLLVELGHEVVCCVRDEQRFSFPSFIKDHVQVVEVDFLDFNSLSKIPQDINGAYYLMHSMSGSSHDFQMLEEQSAQNFIQALSMTSCRHVVYLSGIVNEQHLSEHLSSRKRVEQILSSATSFKLTTLRAGIIIGSGSASFEIIRDLVEKLPMMVTPKWLNTKCQPIAIRNVLELLSKVIFQEEKYVGSYDIGGPDVLTYKQMLLGFAKVRHLKRLIITLPIMTPRLSSYWLYFVTSTSYALATALVDSMKVEVVCRPNALMQNLKVVPISYKDALKMAFKKIEENNIVSSWKDAMISGVSQIKLSEFIHVPTYGCFVDHRQIPIEDEARVMDNVFAIGGERGWYYANFLWKVRGFIDKLVGGIGLRRGRTSPVELDIGDALDFWRVIYVSKETKRLLLYAEMKLPGEAWLEFKIENKILYQTATFRPQGIWGRLYWFSVLPFHGFIFKGMIKNIANSKSVFYNY